MRLKTCFAVALGVAAAILPTTLPTHAAGTDIYQAIVTREFGTASDELAAVEKEIKNASPDQYPQIEAKLIAVLEAPGATFPGKQFACQMLRTVGSAKCLPAVSRLLTDEKLSHMARFVFLGLQDPAVDASLRQALGQAQGNLRIGIINTIGDRADRGSVQAVAALLSGTDEATQRASLNALGKIGGPQAASALAAFSGRARKSPDALQIAWGDAYLRSAGSLVAVDAARASKIYRALFEGAFPVSVRAGAFTAIAQMEKEQAVPLIIKTLSAGEGQLRQVAVGAVISVPGNAATKAMAGELARLAAETKVVLLDALSARGDAEGLTPMVNTLAADKDETIRATAIKALARLGDASSVPVLTAALNAPDSAAAANQTLVDLQGRGVAEALIQQAGTASPAARASLFNVLAERRQAEALPAIRKAVTDPDAAIRRAALKALGALGTPPDLATLSDMVLATKDAAERDQVAQAMADVGGRMPDKAARCEPVLQAWSKADAPTKVRLLSVLWNLGGDKALQTVRGALAGEAELRKAAVKALADWPDSAPMDDLLGIAKNDKETSNQILALRGYIKMAGQSGSSEQKLKAFREALALATRPEEQRLVMTGLAEVRHADSLKLVEPYLEKAGLEREAFVAYEKIAESLSGKQPAVAKEALLRVSEKAADEGLRNKAKKALDKIK